MRSIIILLLFLTLTSFQEKKSNPLQSVNSIIGDISYLQKFGKAPHKNCDETERIRTHLEYVENILRNKEVKHLTSEQTTKRLILLNHLKDYIAAGKYPKNYDFKNQRKPCFIDAEGSICAVGYLVQQSEQSAAAQTINSEFQYSTIYEMKSDLLDEWILASGLSKIEVAMIQPNYGFQKPTKSVGYTYGVTISAFTLANVGLSIASIAKWRDNNFNKNVPQLGLFLGTTSLALNALIYQPSARTDFRKIFSNVNLISSVVSIGVNGFRLLNYKNEHREKKVSWDLKIQTGLRNQLAIGFVINKKL